jgi:hypothetical protein
VTTKSRSHFVATILPYIEQLAVHRGAGIEDHHEREDAESELIAKAWEIYTELADQEPEPALCRVLCQIYKPDPPWVGKPEPDEKILSLSNPRIRRLAEAVPA